MVCYFRSTGATAVEMLTGNPPWHELEVYQAILQIGTTRTAKYLLHPNPSSQLLDFLEKTFKPMEEDRPTAVELTAHPWLSM